MKTKSLTFLLALTFLFLFSGSVYGQEEVKKEYWDNGKSRSEERYQDGKKEGFWAWWFKSGAKRSEGHFKDGKKSGLWTEWDEDGKKTFQ